MSADEYLALERAADAKHELWDGEVFAMAGASLVHNVLVGNLARVFGNLLADGPCLVLPSDMKVYVPRTEGFVYPDLSVVCEPPQFHAGRGGALSLACLAGTVAVDEVYLKLDLPAR